MKIKLQFSRWLFFIFLHSIFILPSYSQNADKPSATPEQTIVFTGSSTGEPLQWVDEDGTKRGFFIDIQNQLGQSGHRATINKLVDWQDAMQAVENGQADAIALFSSSERSERFDFSIPFFHLGHAIFSHINGEQFRSVNDLEGHTVALVEDAFAVSRLAQEDLSVNIMLVPSEQQCLDAVHKQRADACIETTLVSKRIASDLNVKQTSSPFWHQSYVYAVAQGNTETLAWLNEQLKAVQSDGTFFSIYKQWEPQLEWSQPTIRDHISTILWIVTPLFVIFLIGFTINRYLKRELKLRTQDLRYIADHDVVTGLDNYKSYTETLEQQLVDDPSWKPIVAFIRLNNLKTVAGIFGRTGHEKLIKDFARRLAELDFLQKAHLGVGFYAITAEPGTAPKEIFRQLSFSCEIDGIKIDPHLIIGFSIPEQNFAISQSLSDECVRRAIVAYSSAIKQNLSWIIYTPELEPDKTNLILLHDAQHHGTEDMYMVFQPKLDVKTGFLHEAEALIRWNHPTLGPVSPAIFIPLLESTGLIRHITRWVVDESIKALKQLSKTDPSFSISVNISSRDLLDREFISFITHDIAPEIRERLCLEITETGIIDDFDQAQEVIQVLVDAGIKCAIDDFGTGHSCLVYLSRFDIHEVKLDRSFVADAINKGRDREIVSSTIELAHTLGHRVTAEGVEDKETLQLLADMKCDTIQGYVIAKPMPIKELESMLGRRYYDCNLDVIEST